MKVNARSGKLRALLQPPLQPIMNRFLVHRILLAEG